MAYLKRKGKNHAPSEMRNDYIDLKKATVFKGYEKSNIIIPRKLETTLINSSHLEYKSP